MPTTDTDLSNPALLLVDLQRDYLADGGFLAAAGRRRMTDGDVAGLADHARRLADAFRARGRP